MSKVNDLVSDYGLDAQDADRIRACLTAIALDPEDDRVVSAVGKALDHSGMETFDPELRVRVWCVAIYVNETKGNPDRESAAREIQEKLGVDQIRWQRSIADEPVLAEFGFTTPEGWCCPLTLALGRRIQRTIVDIVKQSMEQCAGPENHPNKLP